MAKSVGSKKKQEFFCKFCGGKINVFAEAKHHGKIKIIAECSQCHVRARRPRNIAAETYKSPYNTKGGE